MQPADIVRRVYNDAVQFGEPFSSLPEEDQESLRELLRQLEEAEHGPLPYRQIVLPMLLSKNGRLSDARAVADQAYRESPGWETAVAAANAARRAGDLDGAVAMFTKAADYNPNAVPTWLDIGDMRLEQKRYAEALAAYETALAKEPFNQWALPSAFYCRHKLGLEGNWLASLREVANQEGCTCGMEGCLTALLGTYGSADGIARAESLLAMLGEAA